MISTEMVPLLLVDGLISATVLLGIAFALRRYTRHLLALVLIVAALAYIWFAYRAGESPVWLLTELIGVGIYGTMGLLGINRSPWWLVAGWSLHPLWDILLHFTGPGHDFAPVTYTIPCLSFDLLVAGVIAVGIVRGWRSLANQPTVVGQPT